MRDEMLKNTLAKKLINRNDAKYFKLRLPMQLLRRTQW